MDKKARYGSLILVFATVQFIIAMVVIQLAYPCTNYCYNILTNAISDLGNTATSPLWYVFTASLVLFGILLIIGIVLARGTFAKRGTLLVAIALLVLSSLGAIGVGLFPENVNLSVHSFCASVAFFLGGISMIIFGINELGQKRNTSYSYYSIASGVFTALLFVIAVAYFPSLSKSGPGIGFGAIERLVAGPLLLWVIVTGARWLKR